MDTRLPKFAQRNQEFEGDRIVIIAILAAMLFPSLQKARQRVQLVSCSSNLKQIGTGLNFYKDDNREYLPIPIISAAGAYKNWKWQNFIAPYLVPGLKITTNSGYINQDTKRPYGVFACPAQTATATTSHKHYGLNINVKGGTVSGKAWSWRHTAKIKKPSLRLLIADNGSTTSTEDSPEQLSSQTHPYSGSIRHGLMINVLYADGHVESIKESQMPESGGFKYSWGLFLSY